MSQSSGLGLRRVWSVTGTKPWTMRGVAVGVGRAGLFCAPGAGARGGFWACPNEPKAYNSATLSTHCLIVCVIVSSPWFERHSFRYVLARCSRGLVISMSYGRELDVAFGAPATKPYMAAFHPSSLPAADRNLRALPVATTAMVPYCRIEHNPEGPKNAKREGGGVRRHPIDTARVINCGLERVPLECWSAAWTNRSSGGVEVVEEFVCTSCCRLELCRLRTGTGPTAACRRKRDIGLGGRLYQGPGGAGQDALFYILRGLPWRAAPGRQRQSGACRKFLHEALGRPIGRDPVRVYIQPNADRPRGQPRGAGLRRRHRSYPRDQWLSRRSTRAAAERTSSRSHHHSREKMRS